ncbi:MULTISPECIES: hypothetical protein [Paraburkholderia]|uniref:hypothetical protein n=1 Tax=Paraburkholderia TaxID=1822464 RepID=UPI0038BDD458
MVIANDFEISYQLAAFALFGVILIGGLLDTLHLQKLNPRLDGRDARRAAGLGVDRSGAALHLRMH